MQHLESPDLWSQVPSSRLVKQRCLPSSPLKCDCCWLFLHRNKSHSLLQPTPRPIPIEVQWFPFTTNTPGKYFPPNFWSPFFKVLVALNVFPPGSTENPASALSLCLPGLVLRSTSQRRAFLLDSLFSLDYKQRGYRGPCTLVPGRSWPEGALQTRKHFTLLPQPATFQRQQESQAWEPLAK